MPTDPDGEVHVVLTRESVEALARIPEMRVWEVGPTMVRGSKGKSIKRSCASMMANTRKQGRAQKVKKADKKSARLKVRKLKKKNEVVDGLGLCDADFRRTPVGREHIRAIFQELHILDQQAFRDSPTFSPEGTLRMKFDGASNFTWDQVLSSSAKALENMYFGHKFYLVVPCFSTIKFFQMM